MQTIILLEDQVSLKRLHLYLTKKIKISPVINVTAENGQDKAEVRIVRNREYNTQFYMSLTQLSIYTGFVAGAGGTLLCFAAHYFHFTEIKPSFILMIFNGDWKDGWLGILISCLIYGLISIAVASGYYALLKTKRSIIWGGVYGAALFCLVFLVFYPVIPTIQFITNYNIMTILTEASFFILYGIFIGYSISYEYNEQQYWKKVESH
ncbi:hypothetical protein J14TS2_40200 [Bacillus sp. J14TS2]|uniref:YqhR family membrane protein n=1 Tax=Bacillus sp. J14TS2 TaxID=2807188 RepID=UPI001B2C1B92|nr:YqhR family membrane protein [Bacillus sp. J14TS2]GIN73545.1 hypothetical protein J14TS2_40200 [Bacillus sp. J14TS2]